MKNCKNCIHWEEFFGMGPIKGQGNCKELTRQKRESGELQASQGVATGGDGGKDCEFYEMAATVEKTPVQKSAEKLYDKFYEAIPTRVMHFFEHKKLAVKLAIISVRDKIRTLEIICDGMTSRTCRIGSDPSDALSDWRDVEKELMKMEKLILKEAKEEGF